MLIGHLCSLTVINLGHIEALIQFYIANWSLHVWEQPQKHTKILSLECKLCATYIMKTKERLEIPVWHEGNV